MSHQIKFEDNSNIFKNDWKDKKPKITYAIGLRWQYICSLLITKLKIVDSGRLRASLTFITKDKVGQPIKKVPESKPEDFLKGSSSSLGELIVGSNVEYADEQELNNPKGSFIKPAILEYREDYENICKAIMKEE